MPYKSKEQAEEYQLGYQPGYREENKAKIRALIKRWHRANENTAGATNSHSQWTTKDIRVLTEKRDDGKWLYSHKECSVKFGRSYTAIVKQRQKIRMGII